MGETTAITWTDSTFNPWVGCAKVSAGCKNCYASVETFTRRERARGIELWGENAARHVTSDANWKKPLAWNREAAKAGVRRRVFCASLADVFEDRPDLAGPRARLFGLIRATPWCDWLLLTKRPENAARLWAIAAADNALATVDDGTLDVRVPADGREWLPNIWLGTTVEDQRRADERIPHLLRVPAAVRFLSCEPLLEAVDLSDIKVRRSEDVTEYLDALRCDVDSEDDVAFGGRTVNWVIVGGESGHHARPFDVAWARSIVAQCREAGVAPFVKQLGALPQDQGTGLDWPEGVSFLVPGSRVVLDDKKGGDMSEWPADLRVREFPASAVKS